MDTVQNVISQAFIGEPGLCSNSFHLIFLCLEFYFHAYADTIEVIN